MPPVRMRPLIPEPDDAPEPAPLGPPAEADDPRRCQREPNNPHLWEVKFPHPPL
jgi:hypothetical protein